MIIGWSDFGIFTFATAAHYVRAVLRRRPNIPAGIYETELHDTTTTFAAIPVTFNFSPRIESGEH